MEQMKAREVLHLVPLQVTDEVPAELEGGDGVHLLQRLLYPVLTDVPKAHIPCGLQRVRSVGLGHGDECHLSRLYVPAAPCRRVDPLPNLPNPVRQVEKRHKAATYR